MHADQIVQQFLDTHLDAMHDARRRVMGRLVWAAMLGSWLSLSRLARGVSGPDCSMKARLKRVDRYVGHARTGCEGEQVAQALLERLCRWLSPLVIAVDWSATSPGGTFVELRASVVWLGMGRGLTVYQRVYPAAKQGNRIAESGLLASLAKWIPPGTRVIVLTDAGFRAPWFKAVAEQGWGWIGRIRGGNKVCSGDEDWREVVEFGCAAKPKPQRFADSLLTKRNRLHCDLVTVRCRRIGRPRYQRPGHGSKKKTAMEAGRSACEPWVLAHSIELRDLRADEIVALYARRMQIEENFRDTKSLAFGMGAQIGRSRSAPRLQALLLIGTLASFLLWHIGQIAEAEGLHRRFMATTRKTRELSLLTLAKLLCERLDIPISPHGARALWQKLEIAT